MKRDRDKTAPVAGAAATALRADATAPATTTLVLDFDGTITEVDLLDQIASCFGDPEVYDEVERGLHGGRLTLRDVITREFAPVRRRLDDVVAWVLANVRLRRGLPELIALARARGWRVLVLSSGFVELIEPVLEREGLDVELKANRVDPELSGWRVIWRDETVCTECGEACKRTGLPTDGEIVYVGDGISDRCAALASDRIFATRGLARFLAQRGVPFETFDDFHDVVAALRTRS